MKMRYFILGLFLLVFTFSFVSAEVGCCFDISNGFCNLGTESNLCIGDNVEFFPSATCAVNECNLGCCNLGSDFPFVTARECSVRSEQRGFEFNWQEMDADSCRLLSLASEEGACRLGNYGDKCKISTRDKCSSGDFTFNVNCVDLGIYNQTSNTVCYKENVYFKDSAGNPSNLSEACNYDEGKICKPRSANSAYCADINCVEKDGTSRKNGESWCSFDSTKYFDLNEIYTDGELSWAQVGSRFFTKYCSNGEIFTEPCADYRLEFCNQGKCEINKGDECFLANVQDKETGVNKIDEEACNGDYCYTKKPMDCVESGGRNFCGGERNDYVNSGSSEAKEFASGPLEALNLNICVPKIPIGMDLSNTILTSNSDEQTSVCSIGNFESAELQFGYHGGKDLVHGSSNVGLYLSIMPLGLQWESENDWYYFPVLGGNGYGYIALADKIYNSWISEETPPGYPWELKKYISEGYDEIMNSAVEGKKMDVSGNVLGLLGGRCNVISDCGSSSNWVGGTGGSGIGNSDAGESMSMGGTQKDPVFNFGGYSCGPYSAPSGGDCSRCGSDGFPCSEYRCN
ncbi:MAG: hypothetical protein Q8L27_04495, partial [archaeon]|nr:hypothetical protein [archaeon]